MEISGDWVEGHMLGRSKSWWELLAMGVLDKWLFYSPPSGGSSAGEGLA